MNCTEITHIKALNIPTRANSQFLNTNKPIIINVASSIKPDKSCFILLYLAIKKLITSNPPLIPLPKYAKIRQAHTKKHPKKLYKIMTIQYFLVIYMSEYIDVMLLK